MDFELKPQKFRCPYCSAVISVLLDPSVSRQSYYEDCEVCCNAIQISYESSNGEIVYFSATRES